MNEQRFEWSELNKKGQTFVGLIYNWGHHWIKSFARVPPFTAHLICKIVFRTNNEFIPDRNWMYTVRVKDPYPFNENKIIAAFSYVFMINCWPWENGSRCCFGTLVNFPINHCYALVSDAFLVPPFKWKCILMNKLNPSRKFSPFTMIKWVKRDKVHDSLVLFISLPVVVL